MFAKYENSSTGQIGYAGVVTVRDYYRAHKFHNAETRDTWSLHHLDDGTPVRLFHHYSECYGARDFELVEPRRLGDIDFDGERCADYADTMIVGVERSGPNHYCGGKVEWIVWHAFTRSLPNGGSWQETKIAYVSRDHDGLLHFAQPA